jgi:hypothetical protein
VTTTTGDKAGTSKADGTAVYLICEQPYDPTDEDSLNYGFGNLVAERIDAGGVSAGDYYFKERGSDKILCRQNGQWTRRDDTNHNGCFFFLNGALATFNPEEPGEHGNGVIEFRVSRIGNA